MDIESRFLLPEKEGGVYCLVGQAEGGCVHFCDLLNAPHILVGGYSGSGKSVFLRGVILSLILNYTPKEVGLVLVDSKQSGEFVVYDGVPHLLGKELSFALSEMECRQSGDRENQSTIVVLIDEFSALSDEEKEMVEILIQRGHGIGIHVILATQRVTKEVVSPALKEGLCTVVSCALKEKKDSKFALGKKGAEKLLGNGDMLYKDRGGAIMRLQAGYVQERDVQKIVRAVKEKYPCGG